MINLVLTFGVFKKLNKYMLQSLSNFCIILLMNSKEKKKTQNAYKIALKYSPFYLVSIIFLIISQYLNSLISLFIGQALGIFAGEDEVILPGFLKYFYNSTSLETKITSLCLILLGVGLVMCIFRFIRSILRKHFNFIVETQVSSSFFSHAIKLPKKFISSHSTGDIIQRNIQDSKRFQSFVGDSSFNIIYTLVNLGVCFFNIFYLSAFNFSITLALVFVIIIFQTLYSILVIRKREIELSKMRSAMDSVTQQSFSNILMVKSFAGEEKEIDKLSKLNDKTNRKKYNVDLLYARYWIVIDIISVIYNALIIVIIGYQFVKGKIGLGITTSLILYNEEVLSACSDLINRINRFIRTSVSGKRLNEYFAEDDDYAEDGTLTPELTGEIEVQNLSVKFEDNDRLILDDVSFSVKPGELVGIVGRSGSGKSSLINVLTRLDDYTSGSIKYSGVELKDINKKYLRQNVGIINQDSFVFSNTILENLTILTDGDYESKVKAVCLDDDIAKFPSGYQTMVGERGVTLSGGQKQRISIARTLMKNPKILFLDDSLSAVDSNVSASIKETIQNTDATIILVSHNLLNVVDADKIIVLEDGKIEAIGTHKQLIKKKGLYKELWTLQQKVKEVDSEK